MATANLAAGDTTSYSELLEIMNTNLLWSITTRRVLRNELIITCNIIAVYF